MLVTTLRWFTLVCVLSWLVVYWRGGLRAIADLRRSLSLGRSQRDPLLMIPIMLFLLGLVGTGALMSAGYIPTPLWQSRAVNLAGSLIAVTGMAGTFYCRHYLGRFWTAETNLLEGHQVVDRGPYGVVRHPIYTCAILMGLGLGLVYPTWWSVLLVLGMAVGYGGKALDEDRFLAESLPGYRAYRRRVRYRLFPGVW